MANGLLYGLTHHRVKITLLLHCNFNVTFCMMFQLEIAVRRETLSIKTWSICFVSSLVVFPCQLHKVIEHSSITNSYTEYSYIH